jgi:hypothetical protein
MPPPLPGIIWSTPKLPVAESSEKVLLASVSVPKLAMPPPSSAESSEKVQAVTQDKGSGRVSE